MFNIGVQNNSKLELVTNARVKLWCQGVQIQLGRDWAPIYGIYAVITFPAAAAATPGTTMFPLYIEDVSDAPGALGYHDIDAKGVPFIKVFAKDTMDAGISISSVISHEILELLGDTYVEGTVLVDNGDGTGVLYAAEVCDPVENDLYKINGVEVSNFVTPWWFTKTPPAGASFDFLKRLKSPFTMTAGGYFSLNIISAAGGLSGWQQRNGAEARHWNGSESRANFLLRSK